MVYTLRTNATILLSRLFVLGIELLNLSSTSRTDFIRNGKDENLIGNAYACKRLEILQAGFANGMTIPVYFPTLRLTDVM